MEECSRLGWPEEANLFHQYHEYNNAPFILPWLPQTSISSSTIPVAHGGYLSSSMSVDARAAVPSVSHSQAEKRRRERINGHLSTLRHLLPRADKMDKAALLGSVVNQVKELKRKAIEVGKLYTIPSDVDEIFVDRDNSADHINTNNKDCIAFKASVCCEDRPELLTDLSQALNGLKLRIVKADMATLGGRVINVMILCSNESEDKVCLSSLKQSIKAVLGRVASMSMPSVSAFSSKRQRMLLPSNYSHLSL
ncbi:Transcription factor bhlh [Thalictrum thalictroides]|uniref:Transcription factor bhlh n=1 Tax=Thalictrum thalictroides TaxID=46969 RepID=A0A7J6WVV0_THATH|nr:Transcription factor bhlh [Thalictrum thalictroides]